MFAYFAIIALASWWHPSWLEYWLRLWSPVVEMMREFLPVFDYFERRFVERGFGHRLPVVHHLLMAGWLFLLPLLLI
jgi:hypothetical protein